MSPFLWWALICVGYLAFLVVVLLLMAGCREADRIESRWVRDEAVRRTFREKS